MEPSWAKQTFLLEQRTVIPLKMKYIYPNLVFFCPIVFWLSMNTLVRAVWIARNHDPICLYLSHAFTEHSGRTVEAEKDHRRSSPWVHPYVWMLGSSIVECFDFGSD